MVLPALRVAGLVALVATAGCAPFEQAPPAKVVEAGAPKKALAEAPAAPTPPPEVKSAAAEPAPPSAAPPSADTPATGAVEAGASAAKPEIAADKPAAKAPAEPAPKETATASAQPPLDLNALEKRLKDTEAIGVFTKLTLKNQVDDLIGRFEAHHVGANRVSLAELRQPYDLLIIKVLTLLQDRDTRLANDLLKSREAIWNILSDPAKFQRLVNENRS